MPTLRFLKDFLKHDQLLKTNVSISDIGVFKVEGLRAAIEAEVTAYALNHYRHGVSATFSKPTERYHYCIKIHVKSWFPVKNTSAREMKIGHILLLSVFLLVPVFYSYLSFYLQ